MSDTFMPLTYAPSAKLSIVNLDKSTKFEQIDAQYNPKELSIDKSTKWEEGKDAKANVKALTFKSGSNKIMSFELFFDGFEEGKDVREKVSELMALTEINEKAGNQEDKHPPRVMVIFGPGNDGWIRGVVESLGVKYTMFNEKGVPVRANCSIKIKEVPAS